LIQETTTLSPSPSPDDLSLPKVSVRLLGEDRLPEKYLYDPIVHCPKLDGNWIWVTVMNEEIVGYLIAAPVHGAALLLRLRLDIETPRTALIPLLRRFFRDCRERKMNGFFGYFDMQSDIENRLAVLVAKVEGKIWFAPVLAVAAPIPKESL
jgi:hypothetical protein